MVDDGRLSISRCLEEMAPLWRPWPEPLPEREFDPGRVRSEMDELANEVGLNAAETDYLTEYFKVVEKLNLSKAYNLFFNFEPLTVAGARAERREILALLTQVWEDDVDAGRKVAGEDAWPYLTVAECEGAGYAISLRPEDRGAVCFYDKTLYPIVELASLEECVHQLWRGVVLGEVTTTGEFVDHTPDFDIWTAPD